MVKESAETTKQPGASSLAELLGGYGESEDIACVVVNARGRITEWNKGAEKLFGWRREEISGKPLSTLGLANEAGREMQARHRSGKKVDIRTWSAQAGDKGGQVLLATDIAEKKFLERALLEAAEREQRRIGQELHDHLCQHLLGAAFAAKALAGALDREGSSHAAALHDLARLINDSVMQAREISRGLHPVELDAEGLMAALQELSSRASRGAACSFTCAKPVRVSDSETAGHAFRIAQEAVVQAMQTGAQNISITLTPHEDSILLEIRDDASNENELTSSPQGTAARTLQYRAQAMHGHLTIAYQPGRGTQTSCTFPAKS